MPYSARVHTDPAKEARRPRPAAKASQPSACSAAQRISEQVVQRRAGMAAAEGAASTGGVTGLPARLRAGVEALSGLAMSDVRVHRNSAEPDKLDALAFTKGSDIHLGPGQEQHLPHEAWHVVQQKQGRVRPTALLAGEAAFNDSVALEREADGMGARAAAESAPAAGTGRKAASAGAAATGTIQAMLIKVVTKRVDAHTRQISKVLFEGRVPTVVTSGQGDHTVAEALMELRVEQFCLGKTHAEVAESIFQLFVLLDAEAKTRFKSDDNKMTALDQQKIQSDATAYKDMVAKGAEGEDLNEALSNLLTAFMRLWNKRAGSAYLRSEGMTSGGGDEKAGKKGIREVTAKADALGDSPDLKILLARSLTQMIDFKAKMDLPQAARHLAHTIEIVLQTVGDEAQFYYNDIATLAIDLYSEHQALNKKQYEDLDEAVMALLRGPEHGGMD